MSPTGGASRRIAALATLGAGGRRITHSPYRPHGESVPLIRAAVSKAAPRSVNHEAMATSPPPRILIVDDSRSDAKLLTLWLQRSRLAPEIHVATTGQEALRMLRDSAGPFASQPPLVLLDIHLPDMWGWDLLELARQDPVLTNVPIIVLTGTELAEDREKAAQLGAKGYQGKPFDADEFARLVAEIEAVLAGG